MADTEFTIQDAATGQETVLDGDVILLDATDTGRRATGDGVTVDQASDLQWTQNVGGIGVVAPVVSRIQGRFAPGVSGNPGGRGGRGKALLDAFAKRFPPDRCMDMLDLAAEIAIKTNSARTLKEIVELRLNYSAGKPPKFIVNTKTSPREFLDALATMQLETGDNDGETIEPDS